VCCGDYAKMRCVF